MNTIGQTIAKLRKSSAMTQEDLASVIGVSSQSISKWETGATMPDILLLPVIAAAFHISIDALFGIESAVGQQLSADRAFDTAERLLLTAMASCGQNVSYEQLAEILHADKNLRTAIIRRHGVAYARNEIGGLLLKKPEEGWGSLFEDDDTRQVLLLLGNEIFCKMMKALCTTGTKSFTVSYLSNICNLETAETETAKTLLKQCGLFTAKKIMVSDNEEVMLYEWTDSGKIMALLAVLTYAKEFARFRDFYYLYYGDNTFFVK